MKVTPVMFTKPCPVCDHANHPDQFCEFPGCNCPGPDYDSEED